MPGHHFQPIVRQTPVHQPPEIILFFGHFHPLLVHLPIGMLVALAALELFALLPRFKSAAASAGYVLALAAPLSVVTAICGWLLSLAGGYDAQLLAWHKWLGVATAALTVAAALLFWRGKKSAYRAVLFVAAALLMATGHLGGSLTHGADYLTRYAPAPLKKMLGVSPTKIVAPKFSAEEILRQPVFAAVVEPILEAKCVECHGAQKSKGGLRLDSFAGVHNGGEDGAVIRPGNAAASPLIQRLRLPADSDDHMPPAGKAQPTAAEIALLEWWVNAGAPETNILNQLQPPAEIIAAIAGK